MTSFHSIGDLARSYQLRLGQQQLKLRLEQLSQEMTTGIRADIPKAVGGDVSGISYIESQLKMLAAFQQNASEAQGRLAAMQAVLGQVQSVTDDLGPGLLGETGTLDEGGLRSRIDEIARDFRSLFDALNTNIGGRYLFSGSRTDAAPLGDFDDMLAALDAAVAGATSAADIAANIDAWFDAPPGTGGFADTVYQGDDSGSTQLAVSPDRSIDSDLTANSAGLRDMMKGMAIIAHAAEAGAAIDAETLRNLLAEAGTRLVRGSAGLTEARAQLGYQQAIVTQAQARNAAETTALSTARIDLVGSDPFETVTALQETETRVQSLYTLTARLAGLSLTDYLS